MDDLHLIQKMALLRALELCQRELRKLSFRDDHITYALERAADAIAFANESMREK